MGCGSRGVIAGRVRLCRRSRNECWSSVEGVWVQMLISFAGGRKLGEFGASIIWTGECVRRECEGTRSVRAK